MPHIYKITSPSGKVYVGSTVKSLAQRRAHHKYGYKQWKEMGISKYYCTAYILFDEDITACSWEILEECSKDMLKTRERYWIESLSCVNTNRPAGTRTEEERMETGRKASLAHYYRTKAKLQPAPETV